MLAVQLRIEVLPAYVLGPNETAAYRGELEFVLDVRVEVHHDDMIVTLHRSDHWTQPGEGMEETRLRVVFQVGINSWQTHRARRRYRI